MLCRSFRKGFNLQCFSTKQTAPTLSAEDYFAEASLAHEQGNLLLAESSYKKSLAFNPLLQKAAFNLAIVNHENGKSDAAIFRLRKLIKAAEDSAARAKYTKALAQINQEQGNFKLAVKYYKISLESPESQTDKEVWDNLGNAYGSLGLVEAALDCFRKVTELDPLDVDAQLKVAHTLQDHKKMTEAKEIFLKLLERNGNYVDALVGLAISLTHELGDQSNTSRSDLSSRQLEIHKIFDKAYALEPENPQVLLNFGVFLVETGVNRKLGNEYLTTAVALSPADTDMCYNVGFLKFKHGHGDEALAILENILKVDPHHSDAMVHIGLIHQEKGRVEKALQYYRSAVAANPKNIQNRNLLGMVLQEMGNLAEALEEYLQVLAQSPKDWSVHMNLATIYRQLNELEKSDYHRQQCIKLNPQSKKMFETADAQNTDTDAHVDSLGWDKTGDDGVDDGDADETDPGEVDDYDSDATPMDDENYS